MPPVDPLGSVDALASLSPRRCGGTRPPEVDGDAFVLPVGPLGSEDELDVTSIRPRRCGGV